MRSPCHAVYLEHIEWQVAAIDVSATIDDGIGERSGGAEVPSRSSTRPHCLPQLTELEVSSVYAEVPV